MYNTSMILNIATVKAQKCNHKSKYSILNVFYVQSVTIKFFYIQTFIL